MLRTISASSFSRFQTWLITSLLCCLMAACGGGGGGGQSTGGTAAGTATASSGVTLALVASATDSFGGGAAVTVNAQVQNSSAAVQWQLTGAGSLSSSSGPSVTYTPPAMVTANATVNIQATLPDAATPLTRVVAVNIRAAIVNASANAAQVFTDDLVGVALSAAPQFTGSPVNWSMTGPGSLTGTSGPRISYLPPTVMTSITPVTITASAGGVTQNLNVDVVPAALKTLIASATQAVAGGATVTFSANTILVHGPLTWSLSGAGTLTPNGLTALYTPPASLLADTTVIITATDGINPQLSSLLVHPAPLLSVSAGVPFAVVGGSNVSLTAIQQFSTAPVTWSIAGPGTLDATSGNLVNYVPPATSTLPDATPVRITASAGSLIQTLTLSLHTALGTHWAYALPPGVSYNAIVNGGGKFVAVGDSGTILTSVDGINNWVGAVSGTANLLHGISFGPVAGIGTYIAVGDSGTILTSRDGNTWTPAAIPVSASMSLQGISFGNGKFVAVGMDTANAPSTGAILTSTDGNTWSPLSLPTTATLSGISFANGKFAAVGTNAVGAGTIFTSADGVTWAAPTLPAATLSLFGISHGPVAGTDTFVAVGDAGTTLASGDGITWTATTVPGVASLFGVNHDGTGKFVAVGTDAVSFSATIITSLNGISWTPANFAVGSTPPLFLTSVSFGAGKFVALGASGSIVTSDPTGSTWTTAVAGTAQSLLGVGSNGVATLVAVGQSGTIRTSINAGLTWAAATVTPVTAQDLQAVSFGIGKFVAVGAGGTILTSADGLSWTPATTVPATALDLLQGVSFGNGRFVAVGVNGTTGAGMILTSSDGLTWTPATLPAATPLFLTGVSFNGLDRFVAVGGQGTILTSPDGLTWTPATGQTTAQDLSAVSFGSGKFVAVGLSGTVFNSVDGSSWTTAAASGTAQNLSGVSHGVAVGGVGTIVTSGDQSNWTTAVPATRQDLFGVGFANGQFVAVGASGTILFSNH